MKFKNTPRGYGLIAVAFHWVSAVFAIGLFSSGLWMTSLSYGNPWYHTAPSLHKAFGIMFAAIILGRLAWKGINTKPDPRGMPWEITLSRIVHLGLYCALIALLGSGYLIATGRDHGIDVFGLIEIPALMDIGGYTMTAGAVHFAAAWTLAGLTAAHALAAVKHHFIDKDDVLVRMLGRKA